MQLFGYVAEPFVVNFHAFLFADWTVFAPFSIIERFDRPEDLKSDKK